MRPLAFASAVVMVLSIYTRADAQEPPPRIGPFVVDVRGAIPNFTDDLQLAQSRAVNPRELPGLGLGVDAGAHVYLFKWRTVTFGLGGQLLIARGRSSPPKVAGQPVGRAVSERFTAVAPQLSFNFGSGDGWSYISGGIGPSIWSIVPEGGTSTPADRERLKTINYGGGARWFARRHLAFTFDVRFYAIDPGMPQFGRPGSPRTKILVMGAGVALK